MAANFGHPGPALNRAALERYGNFNVFQLMRLLLLREDGGSWPPERRLRFRAELGASFQGAEITRLQLPPADADGAQGGPVTLHTPNYCVASEIGPLPAPFLEWVREQQRDGSTAMAAFLNLFNQRIHLLRYELKQRNLRTLDTATPEDTRFAEQLAALMGLGLVDQQRQLQQLPKRAWLGLAGLFVNNRRSAAVIGKIMSSYLRAPARLQSLVGRWRDIEGADRIALGRKNNRLGQNSLLGGRMWDPHAAVCLSVGRMDFKRVIDLLPLRKRQKYEELPVSRHGDLSSLIRLLLDRRYDCEVQIEVDRGSIPPAYLDRSKPGVGMRLGHTAWLVSDAKQDGATPPGPAVVRFRVDAYPETTQEAAA
jgi:type VI secretion system protein ImpH